MSTLGQKIKETFTGHRDQDKSDVKTPDVDAPGAFPSDDSATKHHSDHNKLTKEPPEHLHQDKNDDVETGAQHHTGHSHHDPEPETKQATSDAGNYPYWGDLPREGDQQAHRSDGPDSDPTKPHHGLSKESGLATGTSTAGVGAVGAGLLSSDNSKDRDTSRKDEIYRPDSNDDSKFDNTSKGAGAAGIAGATYLATRDKDESDKRGKKPITEASSAPAHAHKNKVVEETKTSTTTTQKPAEAATPTKTTSAGDNSSHKKEEEALAAGAGAAGLAGAGYYASQKGDKKDEEKRDIGSHPTQGSNTHPSSHTSSSHHDLTSEAQKATSAAGNYPYLRDDENKKATKDTVPADAATPSKTTSSGDNESHRKENEALAAGAGASGLAGAGYLASKEREDHKETKHSSPTLGQATSKAKGHGTHTSTPHDPEDDAKRATSKAGNYPYWDDQKKSNVGNDGLAAAGLGGAALAGTGYLASKRPEERKDELSGTSRETSSGTAAPGSLTERDTTSRQIEPTSGGGIHNTVVGAGSSEYSHPVGSSNTTSASHQTTTSSQPSQPVAQAAANQAWNNQHSDHTNLGGDKNIDNKHSDLKYAAAGTAFGAGAAGIAADYGQGKDHETNPRTNQAEKVAERALGSDGAPHAPSATESSGSKNGQSVSPGAISGAAGLADLSGSKGNGSKVLHKCDKCGHDNDISHYFNRDAVFRSQQ